MANPPIPDIVPADDAEVIALAVRSLKAGRTMLPRPRYRFVGVPELPWSEGLPIAAACTAVLDAPDNSVLCVSVDDDGSGGVVIPDVGYCQIVSNSHRPLPVDEGVCQILCDVLPPAIDVVRGDVIGASPWSSIVTPLVVEACRMRMRGTPAFTAMVVGGVDHLDIVASALTSIALTLKVGVIVTIGPGSPSGQSLFEMVGDLSDREVERIESAGLTGYGCVLR